MSKSKKMTHSRDGLSARKQIAKRQTNANQPVVDIDDDDLQWRVPTPSGRPDPKATPNVEYFCEVAGIVVRHNEFDLRTYICLNDKRLPVTEAVKDQRELDDVAIYEVQNRMHLLKCVAPEKTVKAGLMRIGNSNRFHPVREYLNKLKWDGKPRLNRILVDYLDARDTPLNKAIGQAWMISAVKRIREPGCKVDGVLTLQSEQGTGKSTFFRVLASDAWFNDSMEIGAKSKEVIETASGSWIIELAELSNINKREAEEVKRFISVQTDRARTAYKQVANDVKRQFVFGATVNRPDFLTDDTGNRRFWVVKVGKTKIDELKHDRDQLWAEAVQLYEQGASENIPEELWGEAAKVAEKHRVVDPVEERTFDVLSELSGKNAIVLPRDLARVVLGTDDPAKLRGANGRGIAAGARKAEWKPVLGRVPGGRSSGSVRHYRSPRFKPNAPILLTFSEQGGGKLVEAKRDRPL